MFFVIISTRVVIPCEEVAILNRFGPNPGQGLLRGQPTIGPKRAKVVQNTTTTIGIFAFFGSEMTLAFLFGVVGCLF